MSSVARPQDLPPSGGFSKITYERVPHKTFFNGKRIALVTLISYTLGYLGIRAGYRSEARIALEAQSGQNAVQPFLLAERDRVLLRQMRRNRDAEEELMKDIEGWEVGTLFGTPVYNTVGENEWIGYSQDSYYVHADPAEYEPFIYHKHSV